MTRKNPFFNFGHIQNIAVWVCCCVFVLLTLFSCSATKNYAPNKKYARQQLKEDYTLLRNILESKHPSLYWYTSKDSMDFFFDKYYRAIGDSMTEQQFGWKIIAPLTNAIHCGHTSFGMSRAYIRWADKKKFPSFPLIMKVWNDTMAVTNNLNRKDSLFKRGTLITAVNGIRNKQLIAEMFGYMTNLRSMTEGRASFTMEFIRYDIVPQNVATTIIETRK